MGNEVLLPELKEKEGDLVRKVITISTVRDPNNPEYIRFFPKELNYRGHISEIEFSHPVMDFKEQENMKLRLKTAWFSGSFGADNYWSQWLEDERGYGLIHTREFGILKGAFLDYSESRLRQWQEQGLNAHKKVLDKIEKLYYQSEEVKIPRDFFSG